MAHGSLLQMLEDLAGKVRLLEREKRQTAARMQALEHENRELISLVTLAGEKVEEMLKIGANDETLQPQAVNAPETSTAREQLGESPVASQKQLKRLFPNASVSD